MGSSCYPNVFGLPDCGIGHPIQALTTMILFAGMFVVIYIIVREFCKEPKKQQVAKEGLKKNDKH